MRGRNYDVLLLRPQEIKDVIDIKQAIDLVEQGYREAHGFPIINAPRRRVHSKKNVRISNFPGGVDGLGVIGSLTRGEQVMHDPSSQEYPYREHPVYLLWDSTTARLRCIMIGEITEKRIGFSSLMALRTAATSGVGFRYLVRKDLKVAGVFGAGGQALHKILALQNERPIETYKVFSRNFDLVARTICADPPQWLPVALGGRIVSRTGGVVSPAKNGETAMSTHLLDRKDVCSFFGQINASTLYRHIRKGLLPSPIKIGNSSRWLLSECEAALQQMIGGRP